MGAALPLIVLAAIALLAGGGGGSQAEAPEPDEGGGGIDVAKAKKPIVVGYPSDPNVAAFLDGEFAQFMRNAGVNLAKHSTYELTYMSKAPAKGGVRPVAIPDRDYWPNVAEVMVWGVQPLEAELGFPLYIRGLYRAADYNKAVGGAPGSAHVIGNAADLDARKAPKGSGGLERLKLAAARLFVQHPDWPMGLGVYNGNIHVDFMDRRTWEQAKKYVDKVKAGIA